MSGILALVLLAAGQAASDQAYLLQFKPPLNQALHYDMETKVDGPSAADFKIAKTVKITKADGGNYSVVTTFDSVSFGGAGNDQTAQAERWIKSTVITQVIDPRLKVISSDAGRGASAFLVVGLDAALAIGYSDKPVKVGDTWTNEIDNNGAPLEVQLKLLSVGQEHGKQVDTVSVVGLKPPSDASQPILLKIDATTGVLVRLELNMKSADAKSNVVHTLFQLR